MLGQEMQSTGLLKLWASTTMKELEKIMRKAKMKSIAGLIALAIAGVPVAALAHHSFAQFDKTKSVTLQGTVKEWQFTNPHSWLQLLVVEGENGAPQEYSIEGSSVNALARRGWSPTTFKPGDKITVVVNPMLDGSHGGAFVKATLPDGRVLSSGQTPG